MKMIWRGANQRGRFGAVAEARGSVAPAGPRRLARPAASGRYKNVVIRIPDSKSNKRRPPAFKLLLFVLQCFGPCAHFLRQWKTPFFVNGRHHLHNRPAALRLDLVVV